VVFEDVTEVSDRLMKMQTEDETDWLLEHRDRE